MTKTSVLPCKHDDLTFRHLFWYVGCGRITDPKTG